MIGDEQLVLIKEAPEAVCRCASRKCGPHRCRASGGWRAATLVTLLLLLVVCNQLLVDGQEAHTALLARMETRLEEFGTAQRDTNALWLQGQEMRFAKEAQQLWQQTHVLAEQLARTHWALTTPETERDLQLKDAVDACQRVK